MKRVALILIALAVLFLVITPAFAAKVELTWSNPSTYTTGAALPALDHETIYWGSCATTGTPLTFGILKGTQTVNGTVPGAPMFAWVFPSGPGPFCFEMTATAPDGGTSAYSNVVMWTPPPTLGAPMSLGAVLHLTVRKSS